MVRSGEIRAQQAAAAGNGLLLRVADTGVVDRLGSALMFSETDHRYMTRALELAERGLRTTMPNPRVGCVIVRGYDVVGEGWHERTGGPHAEVAALAAAGARAAGATVYVTLEPCAHHGRTPPCVEALLAARPARVVAAMQDPNPQVAGRGLAQLRQAGIAVAQGLLENEARELNIGFVSRMERGRPWVRMKIAASLDGKTALNSGASRWITGPGARRDGHAWRARACAVLTGYGTVRDDDPHLTVREVDAPRQPLRVVVDSRLETLPAAKVLAGGGALVVAAVQDETRARALQSVGTEIMTLSGAAGKVDLGALMRQLAQREINELHVEAGFRLNGSLLREGLVDELIVYLAPLLIGDAARGMFRLPELTSLEGGRVLRYLDVRMIDGDVRIVARPVNV